MIKKRSIIIFMLTVMLALLAWSQTSTDWQSLGEAERKILQQFETDWNQMPAERRERLVRGAQRWQQMSPEQRERLVEFMREFILLQAEPFER